MLSKKLKYLDMLSQFQNCPPDSCKEINAEVFRWVHVEQNDNDFMPVNLIKSPPQRILDDGDRMCMGYGLSMFDSFENALNKYKKMYDGKRIKQRHIFVEDVGTMIANLRLTEEDGIASEPVKTNYGHFTFHEYEDSDMNSKVVSTFNVFKENGEYSD